MKTRYYCYTRGEKPDYRDFIIPADMRAEDVNAISDLVKSILASEFTSDQLSHPPVWVLYKTTNVVVWGICCWNKELSPQHCNTDEKGRNVRGFFSIVLSDFSAYDLRIPYDLSYFVKMYEEEVCPHWYCNQGEHFGCVGRHLYNGTYKFISASDNKFSTLLNTDLFLSKRLGVSNIEEVIESALTFDTITLAIGYDGTDNISVSNAIFMNSIVPGKKEKAVPLKRPCPACGKLVSHYSYCGICEECTKKEEQKKHSNNIVKEKDMEYKEQELTELKRQLRNYRLEIEEKDKKIKRQNGQIKVLWIACGLLLFLSLWLFKNSNIKIYTDFATNSSSTEQKMASSEKQKPELFLNIASQKVEVSAEGQDSVVVGWSTNYSDVEAKISEVNWAKITRKTSNSIVLSIKANESPNERLAQIKIMPSGGEEKIIELYQKSAK